MTNFPLLGVQKSPKITNFSEPLLNAIFEHFTRNFIRVNPTTSAIKCWSWQLKWSFLRGERLKVNEQFLFRHVKREEKSERC